MIRAKGYGFIHEDDVGLPANLHGNGMLRAGAVLPEERTDQVCLRVGDARLNVAEIVDEQAVVCRYRRIGQRRYAAETERDEISPVTVVADRHAVHVGESGNPSAD